MARVKARCYSVKYTCTMYCGECSVVKRACCSFTGPKFNSQLLYNLESSGPQRIVTPAPGDLMSSPHLPRHLNACAHTYINKTNILKHAYIIVVYIVLLVTIKLM